MEPRKLRSGKTYSLWALGHPTLDLNLGKLNVKDEPGDNDTDDLDKPFVLPENYVASSLPDLDTARGLAALQARLPAQLLPSPPTPTPNLSPTEEDCEDVPPVDGNRNAGTISSTPLGLQAKRARERQRKKEKLDGAAGHEALRRTKFIQRSLCVAHSDFLVLGALHSREGYLGVPDRGGEWAGEGTTSQRYAFLREVGGYLDIDTTLEASVDYPFVDQEGKVWAVALAEPLNWEKRRAGIRRAKERLACRVAELKPPENRRGDFRSYQHGFSFGNGRTEPMNFVNRPTVQAALEEFYQDPDVVGLFHYVEGGLRTWFPDHHVDYREAISAVQAIHPNIRTPISNGSFPASTINTGESVVCKPHRDASNDAAGICLDYVDGDYDVHQGGHLILHEARRIVKLRLGGIILFPSAIITHENLPLRPDETRFSITGYIAGGLRRYLAAGGKTLTEWRRADPLAAATHDQQGQGRWISGCARFKTPTELVEYWKSRSAGMPAEPSAETPVPET